MLTPEQILIIKESQAEAFKMKSLPPATLKLAYENQWFNLWVPKVYAGLEASLVEGLTLLEELAYVDGSYAWTVTLCSGANMFAGFLEPSLAKGIFSQPTVCWGGSGRAAGTANWDGEHYILSGEWQYATGAPHLTHFTLNANLLDQGVPVLNEDGEQAESIAKIMDSTWLALYKKGDQFFIGKIKYKIEHAAEEPCSGQPTETILPEYRTYAFFNLQEMKAGAIDSISIQNSVLNPNESSSFSFNGKQYSIKASGRAFDDREKNGAGFYKLELYEDNRLSRVILQQDQYNDTQTEIQFISDFDKDGKPDFIFSSPRDYEEERVIINLSNSPYAFEGSRQFDC